jgi:uncharacterized protein (DUF2252 family)
MPQTASQSIAAFNAGREPERCAMKMAAMRANAFGFLRGTCHLFHQRMIEQNLAPAGPAAWLCGDLHLENFGTYLGDNGLTYFDINDFDEAICAPHSWDILRLATSIIVAAPTLAIDDTAAEDLARQLIEHYYEALARGKPRWIERKTADGPIGDLMNSLRKRDPVKFLDKRTTKKGGRRTLILDPAKTLPLAPSEKPKLTAFLATVAKTSPDPKAFALVDAARRIAGTGSLGVERYVLLVEGTGSPDGNWLLDLKAALPSAVAPYVAFPQPKWTSQAQRVADIQFLFQASPPAFLSAQTYDRAPFLLRQMQPTTDRLNQKDIAAKAGAFENVVREMAYLTAWGHLRGTGRKGSATADALIGATDDRKAIKTVVQCARALADTNAADWAQYCAAFDRGELKVA